MRRERGVGVREEEWLKVSARIERLGEAWSVRERRRGGGKVGKVRRARADVEQAVDREATAIGSEARLVGSMRTG
jgi:hypothetical protein